MKTDSVSFKNTIKIILMSYFLLLVICCFYIFPSHDILFYYYPWSTNLQLSYYDGPPLIAYIIRLSTVVFGATQFAMNIWGVIIAAITCWVIVQIGKLLKGIELGYLLALLWLSFSFSTTRFIFITLNYDCLENLFGLLTILFALKLRNTKNIINLYAIALCGGLSLLAKYSGVVMLLAVLLYFIVSRESRQIFRSIHCYFAIVLCLAVFSPVLIWNYQHNWISFHYQLTTHSWSQGTYHAAKSGLSGVLFYLLTDVLGVTHILWVILLWLFCRQKAQLIIASNVSILFLIFIALFCFFFWLIMSYSAHIAMNYLIVFNGIVMIITGYYLEVLNQRKVLLVLTGLCLLISLGVLINRAFFKVPEVGDVIQYQKLLLSVAPQNGRNFL